MLGRHARPWTLLLLALLSAGCASRPPPAASVAPAPAESATAGSTPEAKARAAFDQYVHAFWSEGDATAVERALSPTMIYHYNGTVVPGGYQQHKDALHNFRGMFPDLTAVTDVYTGSGDHGAAATTWTGSYHGMICGKPSAGAPVSWSVNYVFRVDAGRIVELWETWDEGGLLKKLGIGADACGD